MRGLVDMTAAWALNPGDEICGAAGVVHASDCRPANGYWRAEDLAKQKEKRPVL